ncbi:MAG: DUF4123 domain-containing protein [Polyangiaceae bacterium]
MDEDVDPHAAYYAAARERLERRVANVKRALFAGDDERAQVYAVLDGSRDPSIYYDIYRDARAYDCLFAGKIDPKLATSAPWIVPLDADARFTDRILSRGWGQNWGVFAISRAPLEDLRRHLRRFLIVGTEDGRRLFFRWYDPRVLRPYLRTCTVRELEYVYGPITRWVFEDEEPERLVDARRASGGALDARRIEVG